MGARARTALFAASLALSACTGGAAAGSACTTASDCQGGLVCVPISGAGECQLPGSSCASGAPCQAFELCINGECIFPDAGQPDAG